MRMCLYLAIALVLSLSALPAGVRADDEQDARVEASERFRRGVSLYREGAFRAALIEFQRAYEVKPHYRLLYNIGETQLEIGDYLAASEALRRYLEEGGSDIEPARRDKVEEKLNRLRDRVALISVSVNRDGSEVFIDDKNVGTSPLARGVSVNVGRHRVSVRGPDGATAAEVVDVAGGDIRELSFELKERAPEPAAATGTTSEPVSLATAPEARRESSLYHKLAVGSLATAGALGAGTIAAIVLQRKQFDAYEETINTPGADPNVVATQNINAWRRAVVADVLAGLTLAATAAGVTFWLLDTGAEDADQPRARLGVAGPQLLVQGEF